MPLLVDEVLLNQPGTLVGWMRALFPAAWHGPVLYISAMLGVTVVLRLATLGFGVWQMRSFTRVAKAITYRMRATPR
jgi:ATP-binding cassette subfamily C protein